MTILRSGSLEIQSSVLDRGRIFLHCVQTAPGAHSVLSNGNWETFPLQKSGRDIKLTTYLQRKVPRLKRVELYLFTIRLHRSVLFEHRGNFTFTILLWWVVPQYSFVGGYLHLWEIWPLRNFHSCTVHLDDIKDFYLPTDAQKSCFKRILKFTLKQLLHVSV